MQVETTMKKNIEQTYSPCNQSIINTNKKNHNNKKITPCTQTYSPRT